MKKPVAFYTTCSDEYKKYSEKMQASFRKFYPDIPLIIFTEKDIKEAKENGHPLGIWYGYFGAKVAKDYELVVQIDGDSVVCNTMPHIFESDYEIASVRNSSPHGFTTAAPGIPMLKYLNVGIVASRNESFWTYWDEMSLKVGHTMPFMEQDTFNIIFYSGKYKALVLDNEESQSYYGCSTIGSYKRMYMEGDNIMLDKRVVRAMHTAGNPDLKMWFGECPSDVRTRIDYLVSPNV